MAPGHKKLPHPCYRVSLIRAYVDLKKYPWPYAVQATTSLCQDICKHVGCYLSKCACVRVRVRTCVRAWVFQCFRASIHVRLCRKKKKKKYFLIEIFLFVRRYAGYTRHVDAGQYHEHDYLMISIELFSWIWPWSFECYNPPKSAPVCL